MWSYLRNQRLKQTNRVDLQSFELCNLFQKLMQKVVKKKNLEDESILHNSTELSLDWISK